MPTSLPPKRNVNFDTTRGPLDLSWYGENAFETQFLNSYSWLIPDGEQFIIRNVKPHIPALSPELQEEIKVLFHQEGAHSREHAKVLQSLRSQGLDTGWLGHAIRWLSYKVLEPAFPQICSLATAAGIEHLNALIAARFLRDGAMVRAQQSEMRGLFVWHFCEEIEHKETVYKVLQAVNPSWSVRLGGLIFTLATFIAFLFLQTALLLFRAGDLFKLRTWVQGLKFIFGRRGFAWLTISESFKYLNPGFYPDSADTAEALKAGLAALATLHETSGAETGYRAVFSEFQKTVAKHQRDFGFFFNEVTSAQGAWVEVDDRKLLNLASYSYLGLIRHPHVLQRATEALVAHGAGTHGVRLLGGTLKVHRDLERLIAAFFGREEAVCFSSGFMTNVTTISTLARPGDFVLTDALNHASIVDGCLSSGARVCKFAHNDMSELERKLSKIPRLARKLIVVDGVYSMDGDVAPLPKLVALRDRFPNTMLMVDEAHSLGVLGKSARGIEEHFGLPGSVDVLMGTLSKAIPGQGGYIAGERAIIDYLRYHSRGFIFSAAQPPAAAGAALGAFEVLELEGEVRRKRVMALAEEFVSLLKKADFELGPTQSAVIPIMIRDTKQVFAMAQASFVRGLYVMPVTSPAVAVGQERLRANVTFDHTSADLQFAVSVLIEARKACGLESRASAPKPPPRKRLWSAAFQEAIDGNG